MPDPNEEAMNNLAAGVAADHKVKMAAGVDEYDHVGPSEPRKAKPGDSWFNPETGKARYMWANNRWYANPERGAGSKQALAPEAEKTLEDIDGKTEPAAEAEPEVDNDPAIDVEPQQELEEEEDDTIIEFDTDHFELNIHSLVPDLRDAMLEIFKHRPKPWSQMLAEEQKDVAAALNNACAEMVKRAAELLASQGGMAIRCLLESYTEKDGIKASLKVQAFSEEESLKAVTMLHKARGKTVMVAIAKAADVMEDRDPEIDADQPEIDWDAEPENPHTGGDDDLADGAADEDEIDEFEPDDDFDGHVDASDFEESTEEELAQQEGRRKPDEEED